MSSIADILARATEKLAAAGIDTPRLDAEVLLAHALGLTRAGLFARLREEAICERFDASLERRLRREPVAYIVGGREIWSLWFEVTPDTLIPRPETERLIELALAAIAATTRPRILDIGTGSGCIAIAIASERPDAEVVAIDTSDAALAVARRNAERLGVAAQLSFVNADLRQYAAARPFDLVVANPPYVKRGDIDQLEPEVARFEPRAALDGGDDGLDLVRALLARRCDLLQSGGDILIEIGAEQGDAVAALAAAAGFEGISVERDAAGLQRVLVASSPISGLVFTNPQPLTPNPLPR